MAKINFLDKEKIENLLEMGGGYILDFSNRTFQEFIYEVLEIDIYVKYHGLSKAKILRSIFNDFDNIRVGKVILELLRYMQAKDMIIEENEKLFKEVADIGNILIGKTVTVSKVKEIKEEKPIKNTIDFDYYTNELMNICNITTPQTRGYEFEKYLKRLFDAFNLEPRSGFKIVGEQIDGSFLLYNEVYLLEAKWTNSPISKNDLVIFNEKVSSKSGFTRGLFISFSGYTDEAITTFQNGRTVNIVLMSVTELGKMLSMHNNLADLISKKVRLLCEEGICYKEIDFL